MRFDTYRLHVSSKRSAGVTMLVTMEQAADLLPFPADLALVLLHPDVCVHALAADQLKVAVPPICLLVFQRVHHCKVVFGAPAADMPVLSVPYLILNLTIVVLPAFLP